MSLTKVPQNGKIAVLGAGISGLSFAYFVSKLRPDLKVHIFEKKAEVGGWIKSQNLTTTQGNKVLLEKGPRTLRGVSNGTLLIVDILKNLHKENLVEVLQKTSVANKKYLLGHDKELVQVPDSVSSFAKFVPSSGIFKYEFFKGLIKEPFVVQNTSKQDESIESFFQRRFGTKLLTNNVLSAVLHGIYAGDVSKLSVKSVLPKLAELEQESGSVIKSVIKSMRKKSEKSDKAVGLPSSLFQYQKLISPSANLDALSTELKKYPMIKLSDGLQDFPKTVANYLSEKPNIKLHLNSNITEIDPTGIIKVDGKTEHFDHIRSTIHTQELADLIPQQASTEQLRNILQSLEYVNVFLVNVYSSGIKLIPQGKNGFGFLVPRGDTETGSETNPDSLLGVIFDSDVEQNVIPFSGKSTPKDTSYQKITFMMGGHYYDKIQIPSDSINLKIVKNVLGDILKVDVSQANIIVRDEAKLEVKTIEELRPSDILVSYNLHRNCIPQFNVGYSDSKQALESLLDSEKLKISFGGMAFGNGVGVPDCVSNALEAALELGP